MLMSANQLHLPVGLDLDMLPRFVWRGATAIQFREGVVGGIRQKFFVPKSQGEALFATGRPPIGSRRYRENTNLEKWRSKHPDGGLETINR
jgi:hypothetical protein